MKRKVLSWMATILLGLVFLGIYGCSKRGTLEVSPELKGVLEITHKFGVERLGTYEDPFVSGGIRNIGSQRVNLSVEIEFYDSQKRLLKSERPMFDPGTSLEPGRYTKFTALPGLEPKEIGSYKVIIKSLRRRW